MKVSKIIGLAAMAVMAMAALATAAATAGGIGGGRSSRGRGSQQADHRRHQLLHRLEGGQSTLLGRVDLVTSAGATRSSVKQKVPRKGSKHTHVQHEIQGSHENHLMTYCLA